MDLEAEKEKIGKKGGSVVYVTEEDIIIYVLPGEKSTNDFRVKYKQPGKRERQPKHIHFIIDLYIKLTKNEELTLKLVDYIINVIKNVKPVESYPPKLQIFNKSELVNFEELNRYGEYSIEFIFAAFELIMIQEKTNYPNGTFNLNLFQKFREKGDIFSVVSAATFTNK
nr:hypothetical protein [Candidatus Woesearchaeota archaeon]